MSGATGTEREQMETAIDAALWRPDVRDPEQVRERRMKSAGMQDVSLHHTSGHRAGAPFVEFSFSTACGAVLRFRMAVADAALLQGGLAEAVYGPGVQSAMSSGMPSVDGSPKDGHVPTPVATS